MGISVAEDPRVARSKGLLGNVEEKFRKIQFPIFGEVSSIVGGFLQTVVASQDDPLRLLGEYLAEERGVERSDDVAQTVHRMYLGGWV